MLEMKHEGVVKMPSHLQTYRPLPNPPRRQGLSCSRGTRRGASDLLVPCPLGSAGPPAGRNIVVGTATLSGFVLTLQHLDEPRGVVLVQYLQRADGIGAAAAAKGTAAPQLIYLLSWSGAGKCRILFQQRSEYTGVGPTGTFIVMLDAPPDAVAHNVQIEGRQSIVGQYRSTVGTVRQNKPHELSAHEAFRLSDRLSGP